MRINRLLTPMVLGAGILAGCATTPKDNALLDEAHANYNMLQNDTRAAALAPVELKQATDALANADRAWQNHEDTVDVTHLAYLAKQRVAIAQQTVNRKAADQSIEQATRDRDQLRLSARDSEILSARTQTAQAQQQAAMTQRQLQDAQQHSQQLESELRDLSAKQTARGTVVTLGDVVFGVGQSTLKPGANRTLQKLADALRQDPKLTVSVEGFTDNTGSAARNEDLSERRAEAVRNALAGMGIDASRIKTRGYGEEYPVASNATTAGRQLNRRVEVVISGENGQIEPRSSGNSSSSSSSSSTSTNPSDLSSPSSPANLQNQQNPSSQSSPSGY